MPSLKDLAMDASLGMSMYFANALDRNQITPLSCSELARKEQAYYEQFFQPRASGTIWKTLIAFLAPPIGVLTAAMGLLIYVVH
jgi:hypothetical protein